MGDRVEKVMRAEGLVARDSEAEMQRLSLREKASRRRACASFLFRSFQHESKKRVLKTLHGVEMAVQNASLRHLVAEANRLSGASE